MIRGAGPPDAAVLIALMRELYSHEGLTWDEPAARAALDALLSEPAFGEAALVEVDGRAAGYLVLTFAFSLEFGGRFALLDELYIRDSVRGRGLGRLALDYAAERCRALGMKALRLEVARGNVRAQEIYRRAGFAEHERVLMTRWV